MPQLARPTLPAAFALLTTVTSTAACMDNIEFTDQLTQATVCPVDECGGNASTAGYLRIGEAHVGTGGASNLTNAWGTKYVRFVGPENQPGYVLTAEHGAFQATDGTTVLTGTDLVGASMRFEGLGGNTAVIEFVAVETTQSWTDVSYGIEKYKLALRNNGTSTLTPICEQATDIDDDNAWAVVISGERYDWPGKNVIASGSQGAGWFNIACVGNGLYKMKRMGYDPRPPASSPYTTSDDERQATLKMLTADYCGTGTSFTSPGTALRWHNPDNWSFNLPQASSIQEALWDAGGALCLDEPRVGQDALAAITTECATVGKTLPSCASILGDDTVWSSSIPQTNSP